MTDKALEKKVRALLALAERGSPHEAALAAERAAELAAKFRLDLSSLGPGAPLDEIVMARIYRTGRRLSWAVRTLAGALEDLYPIRVVGSDTLIYAFTRRSIAPAVEATLAELALAMEASLSRARLAGYVAGRKMCGDYRYGWVNMFVVLVGKRKQERAAAGKAEQAGSMALVRATDLAAVDAALREACPDMTQRYAPPVEVNLAVVAGAIDATQYAQGFGAKRIK